MKTQMMQFRVSEEEKALIEKCAKKQNLTVAQYIRGSMVMQMLLEGEAAAVKVVGRALGDKAREVFRKYVEPLAKSAGSKT